MELQRAIDSLLKWMHRYVSPVFLALLMASFILWYIAKLSYIYTTEQKVRVDVDGQVPSRGSVPTCSVTRST